MTTHPAFCVDEPSLQHLVGGDCECLAECCNDDKRCVCLECEGGCGDH